jgi:hypothetical protein
MTQKLAGWTPQFGSWDFKSDVVSYIAPHPGINRPFGICTSNSRVIEGVAHLTVTLPTQKLSSEGPSAGLFIGYSRRAPSYAVGIGGHGRKYTIVRHDPGPGTWTLLEGAGVSDLEIAHEYRLGVHIEHLKISLYDEGNFVFDHLLTTAISQEGRLGLFAWGDTQLLRVW